MDLPFTPAEFFAVFARYNQSVWPLQMVLLRLTRSLHNRRGQLTG